MVELGIKLVPVSVMVKVADPAAAALGDIDTATGKGFAEVPPPVLILLFFLQVIKNKVNSDKSEIRMNFMKLVWRKIIHKLLNHY